MSTLQSQYSHKSILKLFTLKIKLIWDFRGGNGSGTAKHHVIHLNEFIERESIADTTAHHESLSESHSIAYLITPKENMITLRDALKPNRGEKYDE